MRVARIITAVLAGRAPLHAMIDACDECHSPRELARLDKMLAELEPHRHKRAVLLTDAQIDALATVFDAAVMSDGDDFLRCIPMSGAAIGAAHAARAALWHALPAGFFSRKVARLQAKAQRRKGGAQ